MFSLGLNGISRTFSTARTSCTPAVPPVPSGGKPVHALRGLRTCGLLSMLLLAGGTAQAALLQISGAASSGPVDSLGGQLYVPPPQFYSNSSPTGPQSNSATVTFTGCCGDTYAISRASADYGVLRASASTSTNGINGPPYAGGFQSDAHAIASWSDMITFHNPSGQIGNGTAIVSVKMDGSLVVSDGGASIFAPAIGDASYHLTIDSSCAAFPCLDKQGRVVTPVVAAALPPIPPPDAPGTFQFTLSFLFEVPFSISAQLSVIAQAAGGLDLAAGAALASADFGSTVLWNGVLDVLDFQGNSIPFTVTSDSGFNYAQAATATVPLPPSLALLGSGVLSLFGLAWRRI